MSGLACGYAAWNSLRDKADYVQLDYNVPFPDLNNYESVYILGYTPTTEEQFKQLLEYKNHLVIIDDKNHDIHEKLNKYLEDNAEHWGVSKTVGTYLHGETSIRSTWEYFNEGFYLPILLKLIEDRHTWKFELKDTAALYYGMSTIKLNNGYQYWNMIKESGDLLNHVIEKGKVILEYTNNIQNDFINDKENFTFFSYINGENNIRGLMFPYQENSSELASLFLEKHPEIDVVLCVKFLCNSKKDKYTIKSRRDGVNVAETAKWFNGGGQTSSAGFILGKNQSLETLFKFD